MSDEKAKTPKQPESPHSAIGISIGDGGPGESRAPVTQAQPTGESPATAGAKAAGHHDVAEKADESPAEATAGAKKK